MAMIEGSARSMGLEVVGVRGHDGTMTASASAPPARASTAPSSIRSTDAVKLIKERAKAKFDETVEVAMNLGVDPRHADQMVRGVCNLPNGSGRTVRVAVFARGAKADEAKAAGADIVGAEDLFEIVNGGKIDFDRCIATPDMMPLVGRLGKVLGPRGLMPNPKVGTVTMDVNGRGRSRQGRRGRVPRREGRHRPCRHRQGLVRRREARREHQGVRRRGLEGQADRRQGHLHPARRDLLDHGPGRQGRAVDAFWRAKIRLSQEKPGLLKPGFFCRGRCGLSALETAMRMTSSRILFSAYLAQCHGKAMQLPLGFSGVRA